MITIQENCFLVQAGLGDMDKNKYRNIFDPIPRYRYYNDNVEMLEQSDKFRKLHIFTVIKHLKAGKDDSDDI